MADFLLTVGIDTKLSLTDMQKDIAELAKGLQSTPIKIKAEFDMASLNAMRDTITQLSNLTSNTGKVNSVGAADVTGIRKTASAWRALDKAMKGAADTASQTQNIVNTTEQMATATNKMKAAVSKTTILSQGTTQYYNSLRQVNSLLEQVTKNQAKWTAAQHGKSSGAYKDLSMYTYELRNLQQQLQTGQMTAEQFNRSMASIKTGVASASGEIRTAGEATQSWSQRIGGLSSKFATWFGTTQIIMAGVRAVKDMVNNVSEIDSAMIELRKVTDETDETYNAFLDRATKKSQEMGVSIKDTIKATSEFARLGKTVSESEMLAEAAIVYKNVGDIDSMEDASQSIISTMQAFGVQSKDVMSIVDKFNEVGNKYAVSSEGIGEALTRSSSAMKSAGNTLDQSIALITAANTIVQNPESVGTTLKTVSMYLRAAKTEAEEAGESTDGMAASVSKLRDELLALTGGQVDIQSDKNTFKETYQILKELSGVWSSLTDISKANILEMVGGKRNANVVAALLENFSIAEEALQTSLNSDGSAMREYEKWLDSVEAKQLQLKAAWEGLSQDFLSADFVKFAVDALRGLVKALNAVVDTIGGVGTVATGVGLAGLKKFIGAKGLGGLVSLLGAIPAPALAVVAGLTAIGVAAYQAKKHSDNLKIGATLSEDAEQIKEYADNITELNSLMSEVDALELIINTPSSTQEQIDNAKARLEEIATLVNDKYELNIEADTKELKDTLALLSKQQRGDMMADVDDYISKLNKTEYKDAKTSYSSDKKRYDELSQIYSDLENLIDKRGIVSETPYSDQQVSDLFKIDNEIAEYYKKIEDMGYGDLVRDASSQMYGLDLLDIGTELGKVEKKYNKASTTIKNFEESSRKATDYLAQVLASDVALGDSYGIDTSVAKFEQLGTTLTEVGANTDYMAQKFAISRQGVTDLNSAIEDGKLDSVVEEYLNFKDAIGDTSKNAVRGAALLKQGFTEATQVTGESINAVYDDMRKLGESNGVDDYIKNAIEGTSVFAAGFNTLQDVIAAGDEGINKFLTSAKGLYEYEGLFTEDMGLDQKAEELTNFAHQIGLIPDDKSVRIDVDTGEVSVISDFTKKINDVWGSGDKTYNVTVNTEVNGDDIDDYTNKVEALDNKDCSVTFNADGSPARAVIGDITYDLKDYDESTGTATLYAEDGGAIGTIDLVNGKIELLPDKKVITFEATYDGTKGITEYASVIDDLKGRGDISFNIDVNGNTEILNEAEEVIARLEKDENIVFHVDAEGNLEVINTLTNGIQVLDKYGDVKLNVAAQVENFGAIEGLEGDLAKLNGQKCFVTLSADNTPVMAAIGETNFAISDYDKNTGTATLRAENGEAIATINQTTKTINTVPDKTANVNADVTGTEDVQNLDNTIENTNSKAVTVSAATSGESALERLKNLIDGIKSKAVRVVAKIFGGGGVDGTAHAGGTAHVDGTAFKAGSWGTKNSGTALGGELGEELVVRNGKFFTIGSDSAEFFSYKKDDIIFNAEQTKQIFEKGRITHGRRRGRALYEGSAFAKGTSGNEKSEFEKQYTYHKHSLAMDYETDAEYFNWLENAYKEAYSAGKMELEDTYKYEEEVYSGRKKLNEEAERQRADAYKRYINDAEYLYETHQNEVQLINDLQWGLNSLATTEEERLDTTKKINKAYKELANNKIKDIEHNIDMTLLSSPAEDIRHYYENIKNIAHEEAERLRAAGFDDNSDEIQSMQKKWWEAQEKIRKSYEDMIISPFNNKLSLLDGKADELNSKLDLAQEMFLVDSTRYYEALGIVEEKRLKELINEKDSLNSYLNEAVQSGQIAEYSDEWYKLKNNIDGVTKSINESGVAIVRFAKQRRRIAWDRIDYLHDSFSYFKDESAFLSDLINEDELYGKDGQMTSKGLSALGLHGLNYNISAAAAGSYAAEIKKINRDIIDNPGDDNLIKRRQELLRLQRESILAAKNEKEAMIALVKNGIEKEKEALNDLIDKYKDSLDSAKDLHDYQNKIKKHSEDIVSIEKQLLAYQNDTSEETRATVQKLKKSLAEARENLKETEYEKYISGQKELLDNLYSEYEKLSSEQMEKTEVLFESLIDKINSNSSTIKSTLSKEASSVGTTLSSEMRSVWNSQDTALSKYFNNGGIILNGISGYFENENTSLTGINAALGAIMSDVNNIVKIASYQAKVGIDPEESKNKMMQNSLNWFLATDLSSREALEADNEYYGRAFGYTKKYGSWYDRDGNLAYSISNDEKIRAAVSKMKANSSAWSDASEEKRKRLSNENITYANKIQSLTSEPVYRDDNGVWWIGDRELYSYKTGGLADFTGAAWLDGTPNKPELVLNSDDTKNFIALKDTLKDMANKGVSLSDMFSHEKIPLSGLTDCSSMLSLLRQNDIMRNSRSVGDINITIPIEHVEDYNDFVSKLQKDKQFEKLVRSVSVDLLNGGSTLAKNKFRW